MANKWFISDTHFFHKNIIGYCDRPFKDEKHMNECIADNWNKFVKPEDKVYHLGDVACGMRSGGYTDKDLSKLLFSLNGQMRLIVGNHDPLKSPVLHRRFEKIELWKGFKEYNFTCVHIPLPLKALRDGNFCVHGHIHNNNLEDPHYINVCVEQWNYTPVHLDEILKEIAKVK